MPRFFSLTSVVRASSAVAFLSFAACGGPVEGLPLLVSESSVIDCDANPTATACQPPCEETGTCSVTVSIPVAVTDDTGQGRVLYVSMKSEAVGSPTQAVVLMNNARVSALSSSNTATFSSAITTVSGRYLTFSVKDAATGALAETGLSIPATGLRCAGGVGPSNLGPMPWASCYNM